MSKKKKIILGILSLFIIILIIGCFYAGNVLVNYALVRPTGENVSPTQDGTMPASQPYGDEIANGEKEYALFDAWVPTIELQDIQLQSNDGLTLKAIQYKSDQESHKWVILVHGYQSSNQEMRTRARHFFQQGYQVLSPNLRSHGDSDGTYIGMGWLDRSDILLWIDSILQQDPQAQIVLYGVSMGGATVMMNSGDSLPSNVKAIVEDCGYTSVYEMFTQQLAFRFHLPEFPFMQTARIVANTKAGYDIKEASAIDQVKKSITPTLFIHGSNDTFVPTDMVYELYEACNAPKELLIIEGAGHASSAYVDPDIYYETIFQFLETYVH